jgi:hypothetical protein
MLKYAEADSWFHFSDDKTPNTSKSNDALHRVEIGEIIEQKVRDFLGLKKLSHPYPSKPDIFDCENETVGETKALKRGGRVVLYTDQIRRYIRLVDGLNATSSFDRERDKFSVFYFIAAYDPKNETLTDIYKLDREKLESLFAREAKNTKWAFTNKKLKDRIDAIKEPSQISIDGKEMNRDVRYILKRNRRGSFVRLGVKDLEKLCPALSENQKDVSVRIHS